MRSYIRALIFGVGLAAHASAALAADWSAAFPSDQTASWIEGDRLKLIVIDLGDDPEAGAMLRAAFSESDRVKLVMDGSSLGDVSGLDDVAIVSRTQALPVDAVVLLRTFPGEDGSTAVVAIYDKEGQAIGGFSATPSEPVDMNESHSSVGASSAAAAVSSVTQQGSDELAARLDEYLERRIWFQNWAAVNSSTGAVMRSWSVPLKGKFGEPLKGAAFYEYMGKDELASKFRRRRVGSAAIILGGIGSAIVAPLLLFPRYDSNFKPTYDPNTAQKIVGVVAGIAGVTLFSVGLGRSSFPLKGPENLRLVDEFNKELRTELGLPDDIDARLKAATEYSSPFSLNVSPWVSPDGGGLVATGSF
ncbi:MAG: hypothetical protein GXP62_10065 [Oligoflexia bacterium]|nr:hypothetical protein [Oligoflexia bacterium]